jgi:hypothetical protein
MQLCVSVAIGIAGAFFSQRLPMSGKGALAIAGLPLGGMLLAILFC